MTENERSASIDQRGTGHTIVNATVGGNVTNFGPVSIRNTIRSGPASVEARLDRLIELIDQHRDEIDEPDAVRQDAVTLRTEVGRKNRRAEVVRLMLDGLAGAVRVIEPLARLVADIRGMLVP